MGPSRPISLFAEQPRPRQRPYAFVVSIFVHAALVGVIVYGFLFAPRIDMKAASDRYVLRRVDINRPDLERQLASGDKIPYPGPRLAAQAASSRGMEAAPSSSLLQLPQLKLADRTLVQPDIPANQIVLKHAPLPSVLLWSAERPKVQLIAPPAPRKPATADVKPVLVRPNREPNLVDTPISSTPFAARTPISLPGTSSPVVVHGPDPTERVPETSSITSIEPGSAAMMSLSETRIAQGSIFVPPVNQTAPGNSSGAMKAGKSGNSAQPGNGDSASKGTDKGAQHAQGTTGNSAGAVGMQNGTKAGSGANSGAGNNLGNANTNSASINAGAGGQGTQSSFTRINLPQNGQFGVVVVGSSMAEEFPETAPLWGSRLVYSVYLHVGLAKSWILQYSLPPATEASTAGNVNHIDAPWPYYIVRPNESPANVNADALMVHGFVNESGHFETMAVVFPPNFRHSEPVLQALQQWQFRPAKHNGLAAKVEVLLIIPEDVD